MGELEQRIRNTIAECEKQNRESEQLRQAWDKRKRIHQRIRSACASVVVAAAICWLAIASHDAQRAEYEAKWAAARADVAQMRRDFYAKGSECMADAGCECESYTITTYPLADWDVSWSAPHGTPINLGGGKVKYPIQATGYGMAQTYASPVIYEPFMVENCDFIVEGPDYARIYKCVRAGGGE